MTNSGRTSTHTLAQSTLVQTITRDTALSPRRRDVLKPQQGTTRVTIPSPPPPKRNTPETERRFTGLHRKLNGASPDLAGSNCLPKLTTSSPLLLFTGERQTGSRNLIQKRSYHPND
ncbi:hypothetical protein Bca101_034595 [Brassica carinata]